jgi:hypothetical protein
MASQIKISPDCKNSPTTMVVEFNDQLTYFKLPANKKWRAVYNGEALRPAFRKLVRAGAIASLPDAFPLVFNALTKRFVAKSQVLDARFKRTPTLKKKFRNLRFDGGILRKRSVYCNTIRYQILKLRRNPKTDSMFVEYAQQLLKTESKLAVFKTNKPLRLIHDQFFVHDNFEWEKKILPYSKYHKVWQIIHGLGFGSETTPIVDFKIRPEAKYKDALKELHLQLSYGEHEWVNIEPLAWLSKYQGLVFVSSWS